MGITPSSVKVVIGRFPSPVQWGAIPLSLHQAGHVDRFRSQFEGQTNREDDRRRARPVLQVAWRGAWSQNKLFVCRAEVEKGCIITGDADAVWESGVKQVRLAGANKGQI